MKTFTISLILLIIVLLGCSKADYTGIGNTNKYGGLRSPDAGNISINNATVSAFREVLNTKSRSAKTSTTAVMGINSFDRPGTISSVHINPATQWIGDQVGMTFTGYADEFSMLPEWLGQQDNFYLGSLIKGNTISSLEMIPLSERLGEYESRPISASISLPLKIVGGIYNPTELRTSEFYSKLFFANGMNNLQKATFSYGMQEFSYYDELKMVFGTNAKVNAIFFGSSSSSSNEILRIKKTNGLVVKFMQKNFSLLMDTPEPGELYNNLNINALGGSWPAYISSITYGSTGVLAIESDASSETLKSAYENAFNVLGNLVSGGSSVTSTEQGIINNSSMKIYFVGVNGAEAVKSIFSYDELSAYIKRGSTFSPETPGVPISFKMNSLPDNKPLVNNFKIDVPIKPFYVKTVYVEQSPRPISCPCHDMYLTFFADQRGTIPIKIQNSIPIYANTKFLRWERTGSPREGFSQSPVFASEAHYNTNQGNELIIKGVFIRGNEVNQNQFYYLLPIR
ncbi:thiol-activated cytolysin family protein [Pedobacter cryoconitis]|uniref:Thiol-activated cytolysin n=1 Tax=Pedobacter cryoconitis TaxID=188932 RepID=A0A327SBC2_9SPHI|nr:thiol-activated cytolysin family protein [Pedobacter cryoconitis]RAJ26068.1 thiol-activated cytolysin [Pedobacter cryoconitis]